MIRTVFLAFGLLITPATSALADDDRVPVVNDPVVLKECGSCHMAFQPALLPARAWDRMMDGLAGHFGENASLPADIAARVRVYLVDNAGDAAGQGLGDRRGLARKYMRGASDTSLRITENPAFVRKHRRIADSVWPSPKVVTRSNCLACHQGADRGWYEDD
ncbi:MAG: diheme cytochrome c [Magnetospirillum sp.]|nr:diheme cytochrome c [Magnetospirillum sp.]